MWYEESVADVTENKVHQTWSREELGSLGRTIEKFKRTLVQTRNEHFNSFLYTLKYHLLVHMEEIE